MSDIYDPVSEFTNKPVCECGGHIPTVENGGL